MDKLYGLTSLQEIKSSKPLKEGNKEYVRYVVNIPKEWVLDSDIKKGDKLIISGNSKELILKVQK